MVIQTHTLNEESIAEVISESEVIATAEDGLNLLGNLYYQGFDRIMIHQKNITPAFFDLKTGIAGEILQKFSNYRVRLAIIGDFSHYPGQSMRDFIRESNRTGHIYFAASVAEAVEKWLSS
ncbi:MAG: DUF4180 domain-containing protein [Spirosomataceae bacterium]